MLSGDELMGLTRGFLFAGARSLLASRWQVDDLSTVDLMVRFYEGLAEGRPKSAALRTAILATKDTEGTAHPYFWAPFYLLGDPD